MDGSFRKRRFIIVMTFLVCVAAVIVINIPKNNKSVSISKATGQLAIAMISKINIKGRAPKTGYTRDQFGGAWQVDGGCDTRNSILYRDLDDPVVDDTCHVTSGVLHDPYTGKTINFMRGSGTSSSIQIDHVVALSDAWQKGAQLLTREKRIQLANDPLELLAVDGDSNGQKGDGDAATWLPKNKAFRCEYVARQIAIKIKYNLWMTYAENDAIRSVLANCPGQLLPSP